MPKKPPANSLKEKHVERLMRGKKSGIHIGSRAVPHHLNTHERGAFERAIKQRFLTISERERPNLENIWEKYCVAKDWDFFVLKKSDDGIGRIFKDRHFQQELPLKEAKRHLKNTLK